MQPVVGQYLRMLIDMTKRQLDTGHNSASRVRVLNAITIWEEARYIDIGAFGSS